MMHLIFLLAVGCGGQDQTPAPKSAAKPSASKVKSKKAKTTGEKSPLIRGTVRFDRGQGTLTPCGESKTLKLVAGTGNPEQMRKDLGGEVTEVYVEVRGTRQGSDVLRVRAFDLAIADEDHCETSFDHTLQATGNEPFWSLMIDPDNIVLSRIDQPNLALRPFSDKTSEKFKHTFTTTTEADAPVTVVLQRKRCRDAKATAYYPWTATVTLGEETLPGCARGSLPKIVKTPPPVE
jgi:uncharacterized membrane protein